jgi:hypothetical protein
MVIPCGPAYVAGGVGGGRGVSCRTVVRTLQPDELTWFVGRSLAFLGHVDPHGPPSAWRRTCATLAATPRRLRLGSEPRAPSAGVVALHRTPTTTTRPCGCRSRGSRGPGGLRPAGGRASRALRPRGRRARPGRQSPGPGRAPRGAADAARASTSTSSARCVSNSPTCRRSAGPSASRGGASRSMRPCASWSARCEGWPLSDRRWAWLKRSSGPFTPDLWYLAERGSRSPAGRVCALRRQDERGDADVRPHRRGRHPGAPPFDPRCSSGWSSRCCTSWPR